MHPIEELRKPYILRAVMGSGVSRSASADVCDPHVAQHQAGDEAGNAQTGSVWAMSTLALASRIAEVSPLHASL